MAQGRTDILQRLAIKAALPGPDGIPVYEERSMNANPAEGEEVVTILAAALTNLDIAVATGRHYFSAERQSAIIGQEAVAVDAHGRRHFYPVTSLVSPFGSMAERAYARSSKALPIPDGVPDELAAALGNAGLAAWLPLSWRARLQPGESVLILGATGACGLIAVAAARLLGAGRVIAVGRNRAKLDLAGTLGADRMIAAADSTALAEAIRNCGENVDVIIDYLYGPAAEAALERANGGARMVQIGSPLASAITVPAQAMRRHCLDILGFAYYHAPVEVQRQAYAELCRHAAAGRIHIDHEAHPMTEIASLWQRQKQGGTPRFVLRP